MTDQEKAIALGNLILDLRHRVAALSGILDSMRRQDGSLVPWESMEQEG